MCCIHALFCTYRADSCILLTVRLLLIIHFRLWSLYFLLLLFGCLLVSRIAHNQLNGLLWDLVEGCVRVTEESNTFWCHFILVGIWIRERIQERVFLFFHWFSLWIIYGPWWKYFILKFGANPKIRIQGIYMQSRSPLAVNDESPSAGNSQ